MKKIIVGVEGMMCGMCESHVNDVIRNTFNVKKVKSSHSKNRTVIQTEEDIPEDRLREVIGGTGYTVTGVEYK